MVATVDIWPGGDDTRVRRLARIGVAMVTEAEGVADYVAVIVEDGRAAAAAVVNGHRREDGPLVLLDRVLAGRTDALGVVPAGLRDDIVWLLDRPLS
jgi:hypothetical protein